MTPASPTFGEIERFLTIDRWDQQATPGRQRHIFFTKVLEDGTALKTHISHDRSSRPSAGRFASILSEQLKVTREAFWNALQTGMPVPRPVPDIPDGPPSHEAWVVRVLSKDLHFSPAAIESLDTDEARRMVDEFWARPSSDEPPPRSLG